MPWVESVANFQCCTGPDTFGTQSRASKVRCHAEEYYVSVRARRENAAELNARTIDARNCEISRRAHAGSELDRIGCVGEFCSQRPETEDGQTGKAAFAAVSDDDFVCARLGRSDCGKCPTVARADNQYPHARARPRFHARWRPGDVKGGERSRLRNIPRDFGPRRMLKEKGGAACLDRIRLRVDRSELREAQRSQGQTGERRDARANRRRIGIVGPDGSDRADQHTARVCHPIVELAALPDESQQRSPHRTEVASVFGSHLPKTAGIYVEVLYRHLNFG
jgi:hypothetical protein